MATNNVAAGNQEWQMWEHRYKALDDMIDILQRQVEKQVPGEDDNQDGATIKRGTTIKTLLGNFRAFAEEQFYFLYNGLDPERPYLEPVHQFPPDFVLEATLDQVAFDLVVLQGAWYQRSLAQGNTSMERTLAIADKLAYHALLPALQSGLLPFDPEKVTVLTYFQKAPHIRVIPYASVALVGIPFTTLGEYKADKEEDEFGRARDLLAIPHEVGHYVYQHGSANGRRLPFELHDMLQGKPEWLLRWAEEIFADVYGCFIAGPVIVRDFQDLMKDNDVVSFVDDDNEHPTPALRPLIYVDALNILADRCEADEDGPADYLREMAELAEENWKQYRRTRGQDVIDNRREIVKDAIETAFNYLVPPGTVSVDHLWSHPDSAVAGEQAYKNLYKSFYRYVSAEPEGPKSAEPEEAKGAAVFRLTGPPERRASGKKWETPLELIPTLRWLRTIRTSVEGQQPAAGTEAGHEVTKAQQSDSTRIPVEMIPAEVWTLVVSMNGWATNGPETQPEPKLT